MFHLFDYHFQLQNLQDILKNSYEVRVFVILLFMPSPRRWKYILRTVLALIVRCTTKGKALGDLYRWAIVTDNMVCHRTE
jgi:hypothetical protein